MAGVGKSWLAQRIASELSMGGMILEGFSFSKKQCVLFFVGEAGIRLINDRARKTGWQADDNNLVIIDEGRYANENISLDFRKEGRANIESLIEGKQPSIVFFDSYMSFCTADENKWNELRPVLQYLRSLAEKKNIAVVLIHHVRKRRTIERKSPLAQDDVIGSSMFTRYAGLILMLDKKIDDLTKKELPVLVFAEKSWFKKPSFFAFQIISSPSGANYDKVIMRIDNNPQPGGKMEDKLAWHIKSNFHEGQRFTTLDVMKAIGADINSERVLKNGRKCLKAFVDEGWLCCEGKTKTTCFYLPVSEKEE
jgi:hypothetical protein